MTLPRLLLATLLLGASCASPDPPAGDPPAGSRPAATPGLLADSGGAIRRVVTVVTSPRRSTLRNQELVRSLVEGLGPDVHLLILAHREMILDPNPQPRRMTFVEIPDELQFSIWPQDPFVVLRDALGAPRLLAARGYGRMEDREMVRLVAGKLGWKVKESSLFFAGGNLLADDRHAFVAASLLEANADLGLAEPELIGRFEEELGRPVILVGAAGQPVPHIDLILTPLGGGRVALADSNLGAALAEQELAARPDLVHAFEQHAEESFFGHPELKSLTGPDGEVVERPTLADQTKTAIDDSREAAAALDRIARDLEGQGYAVFRLPFLMTRPDRPEHRRRPGGSAGYPVLTYNNVLVERVAGRDVVYLPLYGFSAIDLAARDRWQAAGFEVRSIPGLTTSAMYRGSLRCAVKVLVRDGG